MFTSPILSQTVMPRARRGDTKTEARMPAAGGPQIPRTEGVDCSLRGVQLLLQRYPPTIVLSNPEVPWPPGAASIAAAAADDTSAQPTRRLAERRASAARFAPYDSGPRGRGRAAAASAAHSAGAGAAMGAEDGVGAARSEAPTEVTVAEAARPQARSSVKEAIAKSALDPATIPNVPWASPAWRADVAWREAALEACYRGRSDKALRAALGQALDPRNCPREMTEGAQRENIGVVRLVHAKVAISLMSQTARAADRETARRYQTVALRIEQAGGDVALGHALCKTHLVAHCLLMSREALLNEFAALMHQPPY